MSFAPKSTFTLKMVTKKLTSISTFHLLLVTFTTFTTLLLTTRLVHSKVVTLENLTDIKGNGVIRQIRIMYSTNQSAPVRLTRGSPLYGEVDFVPRYWPANANGVTITVLIPETIRRSRLGGPWIVGWNSERIALPSCRLCTNTNISYTIPVTIYLPDDGWCPEGPIPTGWKIESTLAFPLTDSERVGNTDQTMAMVIDEVAQIEVKNRVGSPFCTGVQETIQYSVPEWIAAAKNVSEAVAAAAAEAE